MIKQSLSMEISMINPHAFAILTSFSKVPILEVKKMGFSEKISVDHQHVHTDLHLRSFVYQFQHSVNQKDFEDFLRSLPDTIYRIKGYVKFSRDLLSIFISIFLWDASIYEGIHEYATQFGFYWRTY